MLALDRASLGGPEAVGGVAAWRPALVRAPDLSHAERVTLGESGSEAPRSRARATADVRWYRAAQARHAVSSPPAAAGPPAARPVHSGVQAYQRTLAMARE